MKVHYDIKHAGTLGAENRTKMSFDEDSVAHLMTVLTDLYSNPALAVIREYSTNAFDAHVAAGNPAPIEVSLPNVMSNQLVIKDYGTGMSKDDITEHFSKYGWSSKRDNDDEVGQLGLGCKSGLTYTSQFTLITIQDGIKNTVLVTREEGGGGVVQIIDTESTEEPNGTEVQIPCSGYTTMNNQANHLFKYWDRGTVLVNGEEPYCIWDDPAVIKLDDDVMLVRKTSQERSQIVMGNVAYPVDEYKLPERLQKNIDIFAAVVRVPIGAVNFTPSREALNYSKRTLDVIETAWEFVQERMFKHVQAQIDKCENARKAFDMWLQWRFTLARTRGITYGNDKYVKYSYRGTAFTEFLHIPSPAQTLLMPLKPTSWSSTDRSERIGQTVALKSCYDAILHVVGFKGTAIAASTKARIRKYCELKGIGGDGNGKIMVYPNVFGAPWLTNATVPRVRFDVIQATHIPEDDEKVERKARPKSKYRTLIGSDTLDGLDELPDSVQCWIPAVFPDVPRKEVFAISGINRVAVVLAADHARFQRDHPDLPTWIEWATARVQTIPLSGSAWDNYIYHKQKAYTDAVPYVMRKFGPPDTLADKELVVIWREYSTNSDRSYKFRDKISSLRGITRYLPSTTGVPEVPKDDTIQPRLDKLKAFYEGMLDWEVHYGQEQLITALNCFYIVKSNLHVIPVL